MNIYFIVIILVKINIKNANNNNNYNPKCPYGVYYNTTPYMVCTRILHHIWYILEYYTIYGVY